MKKTSILFMIVCCLLAWADSGGQARKASKTTDLHNYIMHSYNQGSDRPLDAGRLMTTAVVDTYVLAEFDFEGGVYADPQGWLGVDRTRSKGTFFHIDDFAGLGGGDFGLLVPIEGSQSLWCGARPDAASTTLCNYSSLPGYGNSWDQRFESVEFASSGDVTLEFKTQYDTEAGYDSVFVEYYNKDDDWVQLTAFDGSSSQYVQEVVPSVELDGSVKFRFRFISDGAWSDDDGLHNTDGAVIIDSLSVSDTTGTLDYQNFESESVGDTATTDGDWSTKARPAYGNYAGLVAGSSVLQEDPCRRNLSYLWVFFMGSTATYACGGHPEQLAIPYGKEIDGEMLYLTNEIWSPPFSWTHDIHGTPVPATALSANFEFDLYADNPITPLIFINHAIRSWQGGCPGYWQDRSFVSYLSGKVWTRKIASFADLVEPGADQVQLLLGAYDMCGLWCGGVGSGECHRHAPLYDNVKFYRMNTNGPQWYVRDIDLFQDTFPENGLAVGTGRVDAAIDRAHRSSPTVYPGDSTSVVCADPVDGLVEPEPHTGFGSAVYLYLSVSPQNQPGKMTPSELEEDGFRWPLVDSVVCDEKTWYKFRFDTTFTESAGPRTGPVPDKWCIDVNDHVFTNGDTLEFIFGAVGNAAGTFWSRDRGTVGSMAEACAAPMEMQILPGGGYERGGDILYVDNFDGRGAQPYFDMAFRIIGFEDFVDRYDKRGPSSLVANGLGQRVKNVQAQLIPIYNLIIWNSGDLSSGTVGDGTGSPEKSDDFGTLFTFLDQHTSPSFVGIYFSGDDLAEEWHSLAGASALQFRDIYMPHVLVTGDHTTAHGVSPLAIGEDGSMFDQVAPNEEDTIVVYGGCPVINDFDQIRPLGSSKLHMIYSGTGLATDGAVIAFDSTNSMGNPARVVLSGFSLHNVRDDIPAGVPDYADHLEKIISFLVGCPCPLTPIEPAPLFLNSLSQNYPNPFNPSTTIRYSIKQPGAVSLRIYNVAGQRVRTLVNEAQAPRAEGFTVTWRGKSDAGETVSSGVYFYKLTAKNFVQIKKIVFIK